MTQSKRDIVEDYLEFFAALDIEMEKIGYIFGDTKWLLYRGAGEWLHEIIIPKLADEVRRCHQLFLTRCGAR